MRTLLALAVIATVLGSGLAIKCYNCNSHTHEDCATLTTESAQKYLTDCANEKEGNKYTLCRKLDMYLDMDFGEQHPRENRIHRDCGWEEKEDTVYEEGSHCYYKSGYNTRTWVCSCKTDECNSASLPSATFLLPFATFAAVLRGVY